MMEDTQPSVPAAIDLAGVSKTFRQRRGSPLYALTNVDLVVRPGEIHGLLGRNGAGKSTLVKLICGLQRPTAGSVRTLGQAPDRRRQEVARQIGVVFGQKSSLWWDLSLADNLSTLRALYRVPIEAYKKRKQQIVDGLNLSGVMDRPIRQLSLGERVKSELAGALLHAPRLLVLDEPTIGLDIVSKRHLRTWLSSVVANDGVSVLLTSHDAGDIAALCHRVTLIEQGAVAFVGSVDDLRGTVVGGVSVRLTATERSLSDAELSRIGVVNQWKGCSVEVTDDHSRVSLSGPTERHDDLIQLALELKPSRNGLVLETSTPTLEDALLSRFQRTDR